MFPGLSRIYRVDYLNQDDVSSLVLQLETGKSMQGLPNSVQKADKLPV